MKDAIKYSIIVIVFIICLLGALQALPSDQKVDSSNNTAKVAVILPHPDDETVGLGGNIQILKANGKYIHCVLMTSGNSVWSKLKPVQNYYNIPIPKNANATEFKKLIREDSFMRVMKLWGLEYEMKGFNDGGLNSDIVFETMENLYLQEGYTEFYTVTGDRDPDHKACYDAMKRMIEKYPNLKYREFPIYYYHMNQRIPLTLTNNYTDVDVSKYASQKKAAFQIYYNINTIAPEFYPYSDGLIRESPERVYYVN